MPYIGELRQAETISATDQFPLDQTNTDGTTDTRRAPGALLADWLLGQLGTVDGREGRPGGRGSRARLGRKGMQGLSGRQDRRAGRRNGCAWSGWPGLDHNQLVASDHDQRPRSGGQGGSDRAITYENLLDGETIDGASAAADYTCHDGLSPP